MKIKNSADDDEVIELLESAGLSLTDKDKELIRKTRQDERFARENLPAEAQLKQLCGLGYSARGLIQQSLNSYLAKCQASARTQRGKIDINEIYNSRRAF